MAEGGDRRLRDRRHVDGHADGMGQLPAAGHQPENPSACHPDRRSGGVCRRNPGRAGYAGRLLGPKRSRLRPICLDKQLSGDNLPDAWLAAAVAQLGGHLVGFDRDSRKLLARCQFIGLAPTLMARFAAHGRVEQASHWVAKRPPSRAGPVVRGRYRDSIDRMTADRSTAARGRRECRKTGVDRHLHPVSVSRRTEVSLKRPPAPRPCKLISRIAQGQPPHHRRRRPPGPDLPCWPT